MDYKGQTTALSAVVVFVGMMFLVPTITEKARSLEDESDVSILYAFLGQVRDRLLYLMTDPHERIVPPIMKWTLTGSDINKDVTVSDKLQLTAIDIQLKEADRVFRLYIKSLGDKAVYRVEESVKMRCSLVDVLRTIRSPSELR